jgi:hypothetical protein
MFVGHANYARDQLEMGRSFTRKHSGIRMTRGKPAAVTLTNPNQRSA